MAMTAAERQAKFRARRKAEGLKRKDRWVALDGGVEKPDEGSGIKAGERFYDIYKSFRLGTIHRYFGGTDVSFIAIFSVFEILHNLRDLSDMIYYGDGRKDYAKKWYEDIIKNLNEGDIPIYPAVYKYAFDKPFMTRRKRERMLEAAQRECIEILKRSGLYNFILAELQRNEKQQAVSGKEDA